MNSKNLYASSPKLIYGVVLSLALLIVIVPVTGTVNSLFDYFDLQRKLKVAMAAPKEQKTVSSTDQRLMEKNVDYTKKVFGLLSKSCESNNVTVKHIELPHKSITSDVEVESQQIVFEGAFVNTLKTLNEIADQLEPVKISSITFKTEIVNKEKILVSHVVFQSVKLRDDNE